MWPNPQETPNLVTFTKEILNGKLHFLCNIKVTNYFRKEASIQMIDRVLNTPRCRCTEFNLALKYIDHEALEKKHIFCFTIHKGFHQKFESCRTG